MISHSNKFHFNHNAVSRVLVALTIFSLLVSTFFLVNLPLAKAESTFGYSTVGGTGGYINGNYIEGARYACSESGTLSALTLSFYSKVSASVNVKMALYDASGNFVIASEAHTSVTANEWNNFSCTVSSETLSAQNYYICLLSSGDINNGIAYDDLGASSTVLISNSYASGFPSTISTSQWNTFSLSMMATYTLGGSGGGGTPVLPHAGYDYTLATNATSNYVIASNGTIIFSSGTPATAFANLTYVGNGHTLYVENGTYVSGSSFVWQNGLNTNLTFSPYANFTIQAAVDDAVLKMQSCQNCTLSYATIDGYSSGQSTGDGVNLANCDDCRIINSTITDIRRFGWVCDDTDGVGVHGNNGIINSTVTFCGWNNVQLGGTDYSIGNYAINNTVAYGSDVGISTWGCRNGIVAYNYVHHMNGTTGGGGSSQYGIAVEGYSGNSDCAQIIGNTIDNTVNGIILGVGSDVYSNLVKDNVISNSQIGIQTYKSHFDAIYNNTITTWGTSYKSAIDLDTSTNEAVTFNHATLVSGNGYAFNQKNCFNITISHNNITVPTTGEMVGILMQQNTNTTFCIDNTIVATTGIQILSTCYNNKVDKNNLSGSGTAISDSGVSSLLNPSSSSTNRLIVTDNYANASFTQSYSNNTQKVLTSSGIINVDGTNVTSPYTITMNADHAVYVVGGSLSINNNNYTLTASITSPTNTTQYTNVVSYSVSTSGNDTNPTFQINLYKAGVEVGYNKTASTGVFTGLAAGSYMFAVYTHGDNGASDYKTEYLTVSTYSVTVTNGGHGSTNPSGVYSNFNGESFSALATASSGYTFLNWVISGVGNSTVNPLPLTMNSTLNGKTVTAYFSQNSYTLSASIVLPVAAVYTSGTVAYQVTVSGNDTNPAYQINVYSNSLAVGSNLTSSSGSFYGLSNGNYMFAVHVQGDFGSVDYQTLNFSVSTSSGGGGGGGSTPTPTPAPTTYPTVSPTQNPQGTNEFHLDDLDLGTVKPNSTLTGTLHFTFSGSSYTLISISVSEPLRSWMPNPSVTPYQLYTLNNGASGSGSYVLTFLVPADADLQTYSSEVTVTALDGFGVTHTSTAAVTAKVSVTEENTNPISEAINYLLANPFAIVILIVVLCVAVALLMKTKRK